MRGFARFRGRYESLIRRLDFPKPVWYDTLR